MAEAGRASTVQEKFRDPDVTAKGEKRAVVALTRLSMLWFNTGSLCNLECRHCYMESSPTNDRLAFLSLADVRGYLDEVAREGLPVEEVGFTGGEPFANPAFLDILELVLERGFPALVLTNAMTPMKNRRARLLDLNARFPGRLTLRVSIDHHHREHHEEMRGPGSWARMIEGIGWLVANGFRLTVAGRTCWGEDEATARAGYGALFAAQGVDIDAGDAGQLVLFPEMDDGTDVPEITTACWSILGVQPDSMMCASARMVIKRKGAAGPVVVPCTLLPYDARFELGTSLSGAARQVALNHRHCARFCVLGGASCGG